MIPQDQFKKVADETLGGLVAGPAIFNRAKMQAAAGKQPARRNIPRRVMAMAMSLVLLVSLGALVIPQLTKPAIPVVDTLQSGSGQEGIFRTTADLPRGSLVLSTEEKPAYKGIWERGSGANFPLIRVEGRFYRMLTHPQDVQALQGASLGQVAVFTDEPDLDTGSAILSNVAAMNAEVFAVSGMPKAAVIAARVNDRLRLFQRVSYAGNALLGSESIRDVIPAGATTLQLSDVGTLSDPAAVNRLMDLLLSQSSYQGSGSRSGKQALLIQYANGVVLQLAVRGDSLMGSGTWANPAFFEAFSEAVQQ